MMESRRYWVLEGISECGELQVCGGARRALECLQWAQIAGYGSGWALAIPISSHGRVGEGSTRYTHPPRYPAGTPPRVPTCRTHHDEHVRYSGDSRLRPAQGDPRGR